MDRFMRHFQRPQRVSGFATLLQARQYIPPNRFRHPADRQFASGCSPPRLAATQLPLATKLWPPSAGTSTLLVVRHCGRTVSRYAAGGATFAD